MNYLVQIHDSIFKKNSRAPCEEASKDYNSPTYGADCHSLRTSQMKKIGQLILTYTLTLPTIKHLIITRLAGVIN